MNQVIEKLFCMLVQILLTAVDKKSQNRTLRAAIFHSGKALASIAVH